MKNASLNIMYCIFIIVIAPIILYLYTNSNKQDESIENDIEIYVLNIKDNTTSIMPLEEYVWRATAKEVPVSFQDEAIKAQAVAIRTYAYRKIGANIPAHNGADVCTDFRHCAEFLSKDEEMNRQKADVLKYKTLANETTGEILTFKNEPILAVFHAISSGTTEKSSDVWSAQLPYLTNINSEVDKNVPGFNSSVTFEKNELKQFFPEGLDDKVKIVSRTNGGSVKKIELFGNSYTGQEIRQKLNLRSANFTILENADKYTFNVIGYGHGVGMSQHGANEYAKQGFTYKNILKKYYPLTSITNLNLLKSTRQK